MENSEGVGRMRTAVKITVVFITVLVCCAAFLSPIAFAVQQIELDSVYAMMRFPDPWLVLTPASLPVYAGILREAGMDPDTMEARFAEECIVAEGWSDTFDDSYRLMVNEDERSHTLFDISRATGPERKSIASSFTSARTGSPANLRYQEADWSKTDAMGWVLYLRYNVMEGDVITARGVQYFTIRNGKNYILDWLVGARRVTNRDLARFKEILGGLSFTEGLEIPLPSARLSMYGGFPKETGKAELRLEGFTEPEAALLLTRDTDSGRQTLTVGSANRKGEFTLDVTLPEQGEFTLTLTAEKEGYAEASLTGLLTFQAGWLAVNIDELPGPVYDKPTYRLAGTAPIGANIQILAGDRPAIQRKVGADGRFAVELDTGQPGEYSITLVVSLKGFNDRRIDIAFSRVASEGEERSTLKAGVKRATYAQLLRAPENFVGEVMTFTGEVTEISLGPEVWFLRLNVSRTKGAMWPMVLVCDADPGLAQGVRITFFARANSPYLEQDANGNEISVPALSLLWIDE